MAIITGAASSYFCMHALRREECLDVTHQDIAAAKAGGCAGLPPERYIEYEDDLVARSAMPTLFPDD